MESALVKTIYEQYGREIYFYLLSLCHNPALAEDLMQEVFVKAICSLADSHSNIRAWLYTVARNLCLNELKMQKRMVSLEDLDGSDGFPPAWDEEEGILQRLLRDEKEHLLYESIRKLPLKQRKVLILQYFSGLSVREIAKLTGLSTENVRVLSHRGRKMLREYMEGKL